MLTAPFDTSAPADQQPAWPDPHQLKDVCDTLRSKPPLVTSAEVTTLRSLLASAQTSRALVIQGGDCAELFAESGSAAVQRKLDLLYGLADRCRSATALPVVTIGRLAGQYAKPRSNPVEEIPGGRLVPSYRGDGVNGRQPDPHSRRPDPQRLLTAYDCARTTLEHIRSSWQHRPTAERVYTSHEFLLLDYELPQIQRRHDLRYAGSAHFGWVGERTRHPAGAHVSLVRSIANPTGIKIGPSATPDDVIRLVATVGAAEEPGKITLIVRMGAKALPEALPPIVAAVARQGIPVTWLCDPMHENTVVTPHGQKTRSLVAMKAEIDAFVAVLHRAREWPAGLHIEMTPYRVTECVQDLDDIDASAPLGPYTSACDPRLNAAQSEEIVEHFVKRL
ncbi:phospho-2-dehydro-3-deoxyheptonate aldolase [Streptomyces albospinus]|uniref:Phospho-2-dehydro-3-deoxyheptonate aldolase n=1 Tax=Streptomyces albospinus TaxID=285515 RepID=A0ABQ2V3N1_9ACTN|nr:3-deoxy-7-phosphoheptulonate synthase [Streptomyces albospinus]GGU65189.1 phospho-2-dehydro-3-deoxyheptonate aldolase [Streptomyces albospinus]